MQGSSGRDKRQNYYPLLSEERLEPLVAPVRTGHRETESRPALSDYEVSPLEDEQRVLTPSAPAMPSTRSHRYGVTDEITGEAKSFRGPILEAPENPAGGILPNRLSSMRRPDILKFFANSSVPYLSRAFLMWLALLFACIIAALEVLNAISRREQGIAFAFEDQHYLWTYGPSLGLWPP